MKIGYSSNRVILLLVLWLVSACDVANDSSQMQFHLVPGDGATPGWIAAEGIITEQTPEKFKDFLSERCEQEDICDLHEARVTTVGFHSPGGDLLAAMELGRMIRDMRLNTALVNLLERDIDVPRFSSAGLKSWEGGKCESACAYAFFGGVSRQLALFNAEQAGRNVTKQGVLGVHQFYDGHGFSSKEISTALEGQAEKLEFKTESAKSQYYAALIIRYLSEMGINPNILVTSSETPSYELLYLTKDELLAENAVTLDILTWKRDDSATVALLGHPSLHIEYNSDIYAKAFCLKNSDGTFSVDVTVKFDPEVVMGSVLPDGPVMPTDVKKANEAGKEEYNGFLLSYGNHVTVADNFSMRFAVDQMGSAEMYFDAKLSQWQNIFENGNGVLTLKPLGRLADQQPRQPQINLFLDDIFWGAFRDLADGKLGCRRRAGGPTVADAIGSGRPDSVIKPPQTKEINKALKSTNLSLLEQILFDEGSSNLSEDSRQSLDHLAGRLTARLHERVLLEGRTAQRDGSFATRSDTLRLGAERNEAVSQYLQSQGVKPSQLTSVSYGRERPIVEEFDEYGTALNRAVNISLRQ